MPEPTPYAHALNAFPAPLRELIESELRAGNTIVEISSTFPAPPAGAYVKLQHPVTTRPRESWPGVNFYDRNTNNYSGEFADSKRFFFVLEPPHPPEVERNMDEIREEMQARERATNTDRFAAERAEFEQRLAAKDNPPAPNAHLPATTPPTKRSNEPVRVPTATVARFRESMNIDYERWHEGTSYDLEALRAATAKERAEIENLLLPRATNDWRDIEALAAIDSPRTRAALRAAIQCDRHEIGLAVARCAPQLVTKPELTNLLIRAIETAEFGSGLSEALRHIASFHPPKVVDALFNGLLTRSGGPQIHFAAMLMFLYGKATSTFDWNQRPFFLKFATTDRNERALLVRELCEKIGIDPDSHLSRSHRTGPTD